MKPRGNVALKGELLLRRMSGAGDPPIRGLAQGWFCSATVQLALSILAAVEILARLTQRL